MNIQLQEIIEESRKYTNKHVFQIYLDTLPYLEKKDQSIYDDTSGEYCIRVCTSNTDKFQGTVIGLKRIIERDDKYFVVFTFGSQSRCLLANLTFIKQVSLTSKGITLDNIKGSINGSDIYQSYIIEGKVYENKPDNFIRLFETHKYHNIDMNKTRIVKSTQEIKGTKEKFTCEPTPCRDSIISAFNLACYFYESCYYGIIVDELNNRLHNQLDYIQIARNSHLCGRIVEQLIVDQEENSEIRSMVCKEDYTNLTFSQDFLDLKISIPGSDLCVGIDIKTKIRDGDSNGKGYSIDKFLEYHTNPNSVYLLCSVDVTKEYKNEYKLSLISPIDCSAIKVSKKDNRYTGIQRRGTISFENLESVIKNKIKCDEAIKFLDGTLLPG